MNRRFALKTTAFAAFATLAAGCAQMEQQGDDIVDVAANNDQFSTLVAAVDAADLTETLRGDGPYTVFAPTNAAFDKLPDGTVADLLDPGNRDQLAQILTYHVVPGNVTSDQLIGERMDVATVQGQTVSVDGRVEELGTVKVNDANVTMPDIMASNGVIHAIDTVLMPE